MTAMRGLPMQRVFAPQVPEQAADEELIRKSLTEMIPPRSLLYPANALAGNYLLHCPRSPTTVASMLINYHYAGEAHRGDVTPEAARYLRELLLRDRFRTALERERLAAESRAAGHEPAAKSAILDRANRRRVQDRGFLADRQGFVPAPRATTTSSACSSPRSWTARRATGSTVPPISTTQPDPGSQGAGLSLEQIGRIIDDDAPAELRAMLLIRRTDVEQAAAAESDRLRQIEARIAQIDSEAARGRRRDHPGEPAHRI